MVDVIMFQTFTFAEVKHRTGCSYSAQEHPPVDDICALGLRTKVEIYAEVICFILVAFLAKNTIQNTLMHSQFLQINLRQFTGCKRQALLRTRKEL